MYIFGILISYHIIILSLIKYSLIEFGMDEKYVRSTDFSILISVPITLFVLFPLSLMRDISSLRYVCLVSLGALVYTIIVLIVQLPEYFMYFSQVSSMTPYQIDFNLFTGCSIMFVSYQCQIQLLPIYIEMKNRSLKAVYKVIDFSFAIDFAFYLVIGLVGYFS